MSSRVHFILRSLGSAVFCRRNSRYERFSCKALEPSLRQFGFSDSVVVTTTMRCIKLQIERVGWQGQS